MTNSQNLYWTLQETKRSNRTNEAERQRNNLAVERETQRSNIAREIETNRSNLARENETSRSNRANESINWNKLWEQRRSNLANESIANYNAQTSRMSANFSNQNATMQNLNNLLNVMETIKHNRAQEAVSFGNLRLGENQLVESNRHNLATENIQLLQAGAAQTTANANLMNAYTNQGQLGVAKRNARTNEYNSETQRKGLDVTKRGQNLNFIGNLINAAARAHKDNSVLGSTITDFLE